MVDHVKISMATPSTWRSCTRPGWRTRRLEHLRDAGVSVYVTWDPKRCRLVHFLSSPAEELRTEMRASGLRQVEGSPLRSHQLWVDDTLAADVALGA